MQPVEHADDREDRAVLGPQAVDPGDDLHQAGTTDAAGDDQHLVRAPGDRPGPRSRWPRARRPASAVDSAPRRARTRPPGGRTGRGRRPSTSSTVERDVREAVEARCRSAGAGAAMRAGLVGRGRADGVERHGLGLRERAGRRPPQRPEVRGTPERAHRGRGRAPARTCPAEQRDVERSRSGRSGSVSSQDTSVSSWIVTCALGQLDRLAGTGKRRRRAGHRP